ncbi:glycosyltransferase [Candidatus Babeliales bacterium]|nr:glycosyltransferase [Candidatus Babeliales bacterium]
MKVIHLIANLGVGGAETMLYQRLMVSKDRGELEHHIICYFHDGPFLKSLKDAGFTVIKITGLLRGYDPIGWYQLFQLIKKERPTCLHASLWSASIIARLVGYFTETSTVCDIHGDPEYHGIIRNSIDRLVPYKHVTFVAVTSAIVPSIKKWMPGAQVQVIHNGVNQQYFLQNDTREFSFSQIKQEKIIITVCGRLIPLKRYHLFLHSINLLIKSGQKNIHGLIIGEGPEKANLLALAYKLGIERYVTFVGQQKNMPDWYALSDVLVSCSETEALSLVVLEAMSVGVVVVATASTNAGEVIQHKKNGLLLQTSDFKDMAEALSRLASDSLFRKRLGAAAEATIEKKFDIHIVEKRYEKLYKSLLK